MKKSWKAAAAAAWRGATLGLLLLLGTLGSTAMAGDANGLRAKYGELRSALQNNNYQRPLHIVSSHSGDTLRGDVYAVLDHPYKDLSMGLKDPSDWCDILILPFNTKYCHAVEGNGGAVLQVRIGRKYDQPVQDAYRVEFALRQVAATADYFETRLNAATGPVGTRDYRIVMSAVPLENGRTFMHLSYSYGFGAMGRFAMQAYLSTAGADKVGFTIAGRDAGGQPVYMTGVRGAIERNVMRYYLAIDAYLESLKAPPDQRAERAIRTWFDNTERYPRQLREMDRSTYLAMKRSEHVRQQVMIN
jgi:hypothetical protein